MMAHRNKSAILLSIMAGLLVLTYGCASRSVDREARGSVTLGPPPQQEAAGSDLPELPAQEVTAAEQGRLVEHLEAEGDDVRMILRSLAQSYGMGYEIAPEVQGHVSLSLADATLEQALDAIVLPLGYTYQVQGNVLRVGPTRLETKIFALDFISLSRLGTGTTTVQRRLGGGSRGRGAGNQTGSQTTTGFGGGGSDVIVSTQVSDLWQEISVALEALIFSSVGGAQSGGQAGRAGDVGAGGRGRGAPGALSRVDSAGRRLIVNPVAGTVMISATPEEVQEAEAYVSAFQSAIQRQVRIEARFVEVVLDKESQFGVDWDLVQRVGDLSLRSRGTPLGGNGVQLVLGSGGQQVTSVIRALETQGKVEVLQNPTISTLNNQRAVFNVTTDEIFFSVSRQPIIGPTGATIGFDTQVETQPIAVGVVMDVMPQISSDDVITMNVRPMVTNLVRVEEFSQDGASASAPVVDRREIDTVVRARSGETIVIGGLIQTSRQKVRSGVPVLMDIPLLGGLFSSTTERERRGELVIFITPTIVAGTGPVAP